MKNILKYFVFIIIITNIYGSDIKREIDLVGNAHIDMAYRWRLNETADRVTPDTFEGVIKMMDVVPDLTFAQSQMALYDIARIKYPGLFELMKQKNKEGRWSVTGGQWIEPDAILPSGESLIRQFLIGNEFNEKYLNIDPVNIAWVPDSFCGQALTLPMIYSGCGIQYYVFGRGAPNDKKVFWWQSPDGSQVLAYKAPHHYNVKIDNKLLEIADTWSAISDIDKVMVLFGEGDHGGGPRKPDIDNMERLKKEHPEYKFRYVTPETYFQELDVKNKKFDTYHGELGLFGEENSNFASQWRGSFVSQARIKKANRDMENLFLTAETFATIGTMLQKKPLFPRVDFRDGWKIILLNQFHDILPGTSIGDVFDDALNDYKHLDEEGNRLLKYGLEVIGSRIDTRGEGIPLVVYNPLSWKRTDVVDASIEFIRNTKDFSIMDSSGNPVLFQINDIAQDGLSANVSFLAENIPPVGYKMYRVVNAKPVLLNSDLKYTTYSVSNHFFKISWDSHGELDIINLLSGESILEGKGNVLNLFVEQNSSSWNLNIADKLDEIKPENNTPQVICDGPAKIILKWTDYINNTSSIVRKLILKSHSARIEFEMTVDWHEHDKLLKVSFPTAIDNGIAVFEQPYGYIERKKDGIVWPAQNWIDLSTEQTGFALLNNGKYGFDVNKNTLSASVVHGARDMDPRMDEGVHSFGYAVYPHQGDWKQANVFQQSLEFNRPLLVKQENLHTGDLPGKRAPLQSIQKSLPAEHSFFSIESDHVVLSVIKVQQGDWNPNNLVLRIFETQGRDGKVTVNLPGPLRSINETNHIEKQIDFKSPVSLDEHSFTFEIGKNQLRTFLLAF